MIAVERQVEDEDCEDEKNDYRGKTAVRALSVEDEVQGEVLRSQRMRQEEAVAIPSFFCSKLLG